MISKKNISLIKRIKFSRVVLDQCVRELGLKNTKLTVKTRLMLEEEVKQLLSTVEKLKTK